MEGRIQHLFLTLILLASAPLTAMAQQAEDGSDQREKTVLDAIVEPDLDRREIDEGEIDTENFEAGIYAGVMSFEDFGSNNVVGYRLAYLISEDWFLEGVYGVTETGESLLETAFNIDRIGDDRNVEYYNLSLGVNLLPGEIFLGKNYAFNSAFFLILGAGNTRFADDEFFTYNFGGGARIFVTDWLALRVDFRNHILTHNIFPEEKTIQNLESHFGLSLYF